MKKHRRAAEHVPVIPFAPACLCRVAAATWCAPVILFVQRIFAPAIPIQDAQPMPAPVFRYAAVWVFVRPVPHVRRGTGIQTDVFRGSSESRGAGKASFVGQS